MRARLTQSELQELLEDPNDDNRAKLAGQFAGHIHSADLSPQEKMIAQEIIRVIAKDAAVMVREALAEGLKHSDDLPYEVALELARDVEAVALPLLESSTVFSDEDLIALVRVGSEDKQSAIASRESVTETVSEALVETGNNKVVATLVRNEGADLTEVIMHKVVDKFGEDELVNAPLAMRQDVPATITERLVVLVSEEIRTRMIETGKIEKETVDQMVRESRERATVDLSLRLNQGKDIGRLVRQLHANGRLTPSVVLRAACSGEMRFFEEALAALVGIEYEKAWVLVHDKGELGFKALFDKAGLPGELFHPCRIALDVFHDLEPEFDSDRDEGFARKMMQMVLTQYEDMQGEDLEFLLGRLAKQEDELDAAAPRLNAAEQIVANG